MSTYTPIATQTLGSAAASVTFSSIPQGYTDLVLVANTKAGATDNAIYMRFNGDNASNYSTTELRGNGSTAGSARASSQTAIYPSWYVAPGASNFSHNMILHIMNYSNGTTYKTTLSRGNNTDVNQGTEAAVGLWRSTSAITSIELYLSATTFSIGSTFSIYGIAAGVIGAKAAGGIVTTSSGYVYHTFLNSGAFMPYQNLTCDYLLVAGGGGGGSSLGGGGGAGGLLGSSNQLFTAQSYAITIGAGGLGSSSTKGIIGDNSSIIGGGLSLTSTGGGGGGRGNDGSNSIGVNGGSGGGAGSAVDGVSHAGGTATSGQGYAGGSTTFTLYYGGGGGGGAGAIGSNGAGVNSGLGTGSAGGIGLNTYSSWASATSTGDSGYYSGGGGGGGITDYGSQGGAAIGGTGGGGTGGINGSTAGVYGNANTGGGGGGGGPGGTARGGNGGSGIVIIRYAL